MSPVQGIFWWMILTIQLLIKIWLATMPLQKQNSVAADGLVEVPVAMQKDLRILSKFWSDVNEEEEEEEVSSQVNTQETDDNFELALSKSLKKN